MQIISSTPRASLWPALGLLLFTWIVAPTPATAQSVSAVLDGTDPNQIIEAATDKRRQVIWTEVGEFYEAQGGERVWTKRRGLSKKGKQALETLQRAGEHGLLPRHYRVEEIAALNQGRTRGDDLARLDVEMTAALLHYGSHLLNGRVTPEDVEKKWRTQPRTADLSQELADVLSSKNPAQAFTRAMTPPHPAYETLRRELAQYRKLEDQGGWQKVPSGDVLNAGDSAPADRLTALVDRLAVEGDLSASEAKAARSRLSGGGSGTYDETLSKGVERFQKRNGIVVDGILGPNTLENLNVGAADRVRQIMYNLERWRWLPADFGERNIQVNIASQWLEAYEGGNMVLEMPVVVGRDDWETPVFTDRMEHVVINPYWNVPVSIVKADIAPSVSKDPSYLSRKGFELLNSSGQPVNPSSVSASQLTNYRVRQKPGPQNALGTIKFIFPNDHNVYLHDTPAEAAFDKDKRALSHGCVRVERPLDVAGFVFANQSGWDKGKVQSVMDSREHTTVMLDHQLPVYLLYWTAFVEDGHLEFREDIYGHDKALGAALDQWHKKLPELRGSEASR